MYYISLEYSILCGIGIQQDINGVSYYCVLYDIILCMVCPVLQPPRNKKFKLFRKDQRRKPTKLKVLPLACKVLLACSLDSNWGQREIPVYVLLEI